MIVNTVTFEGWEEMESSFQNLDATMSTVLSMEALSQEGFKETVRHYWQKFLEWLNKLWQWAKEHFTNLKGRLARTRERLEACQGRLEQCRAQKVELEGTGIPLNANQFRALSTTVHTQVSENLLRTVLTTITTTSKVVYTDHFEYVKALIGVLNKSFGNFDVLKADEDYQVLIRDLNQVKFPSGFEPGRTIPMTGLKQLHMTPFPNLEIGYLGILTQKSMVREPTAAFKSPPTTVLADNLIKGYVSALAAALHHTEEALPALVAEQRKLSSVGDSLVRRINQETEGNSNEAHVGKMINQMISMEMEIAKSINPVVIQYSVWLCDTLDIVSDVIGKILDTKLKTDSSATEENPTAATPVSPSH